MAMGEEKGQEATRQVEMVCLDELVPDDDRYRRLDRLVDWGFVRELAAPYYAETVGRPSIDPIVLVKLMVAGALEGIGSMRELLRLAPCASTCAAFWATAFMSACRPTRRSPTPTPRASSTASSSSASSALGGPLPETRPHRGHAPLGRRLPRRGRCRPLLAARQPEAGAEPAAGRGAG